MDALRLAWEGGVARIGGFIPFDVWAAQELGALERGKETGEVPTEYAALPKALADQVSLVGREVALSTSADGSVTYLPL